MEKTQNPINNNPIAFKKWLEILDNKIRFRIFQLLFVYGELSLTELTKQMNKSKPALYHHLQKMIKLGIIQVSKEEAVRGSIKAKHYCLAKKSTFQMQLLSDLNLSQISNPAKRLKAFQNAIGMYKSSITLIRNKLDMIDLYIEYLEDNLKNKETDSVFHNNIPQLISDFNIEFQSLYLTEDQYLEFTKDYSSLIDMFREKIKASEAQMDERSCNLIEHPYFVTSLILPLKNILDLELNKKYKEGFF